MGDRFVEINLPWQEWAELMSTTLMSLSDHDKTVFLDTYKGAVLANRISSKPCPDIMDKIKAIDDFYSQIFGKYIAFKKPFMGESTTNIDLPKSIQTIFQSSYTVTNSNNTSSETVSISPSPNECIDKPHHSQSGEDAILNNSTGLHDSESLTETNNEVFQLVERKFKNKRSRASSTSSDETVTGKKANTGYDPELSGHISSHDSIDISNSYDSLANENDDNRMESTEDFEQPRVVVTRGRKPPPITITQPNIKWNDLEKRLKQANFGFTGKKIAEERLQIYSKTENDHRGITSTLSSNHIQYFTHALNPAKKLQVVIRGLPMDTSESEILSILKEEYNLPVHKVVQMKKLDENRLKVPMPLFFAELVKSAKGKEIFNIKHLMSLVIDVKPYRKNKLPTQCHRCQEYGHSQTSCHNRARCVKCAEPHLTTECPLVRADNPKCALCGGGHTANYKGCEKFPGFRTTAAPRSNPRSNAQPVQEPMHITEDFPEVNNADFTTHQSIPSTSAWAKPPNITGKDTPTQHNSDGSNSKKENKNSFPEMIKQIWDLLKGLDFDKIMTAINDVLEGLSKAKEDPSALIGALVKAVTLLFNKSNNE